ncbi:MAG: elongation factor Ts [Gemmatimonadota bacterium]|jgi:elongation factor Ts
MTRITLDQLKELRARTGSGVLQCRQALEATDGDMGRAEEQLREQARAEAERRAVRETGEGLVGSYVHHTGKLGALVEVTCETDFVARTTEFKDLVTRLAEQVAAAAPQVIDEGSTPEGNDPAESALLAQPWIREPGKTVGQLLEETAGLLGERLTIRRFSRFHLAEAP